MSSSNRSKKNTNTKKKKRKLNYAKIFIFFLTLFIVVFGSVFGIKKLVNTIFSNGSGSIETFSEKKEKIEDKETNVKMTIVGDIMCHGPQITNALNTSTNIYDFSSQFQHVKKYLTDNDFLIGNFETTFAGKDRKYSGYPTFNSPDELGHDLKNCGFDLLSTANNHSLDKGYSGLERTIDKLDELKIDHIGTYKSQEDQEKIYTKTVNDISFAFLSYTYGTNGIPVPSGKNYCINLINKDQMKADIQKAKDQNVDLICVLIHWGVEYQTSANNEQKDLADFLFNEGVDIIFGGHPHVLQSMEKRTITKDDGSTKDVFLVYSLGNFVSGQNDEITRLSAILNINIKKRNNKTTIEDVSYTPTYMYNKGANKKERFLVLDMDKSILDYENKTDQMITSDLYQKLKAGKTKIDTILNPNGL